MGIFSSDEEPSWSDVIYYEEQVKELKAENDRLEEEKDGMQILIDNYITLTEKYHQTLQEIKAIATECTTCGDCCNCKYCEDCDTDLEEQALDVCRMILDLITKAEEE